MDPRRETRGVRLLPLACLDWRRRASARTRQHCLLEEISLVVDDLIVDEEDDANNEKRSQAAERVTSSLLRSCWYRSTASRRR